MGADTPFINISPEICYSHQPPCSAILKSEAHLHQRQPFPATTQNNPRKPNVRLNMSLGQYTNHMTMQMRLPICLMSFSIATCCQTRHAHYNQRSGIYITGTNHFRTTVMCLQGANMSYQFILLCITTASDSELGNLHTDSPKKQLKLDSGSTCVCLQTGYDQHPSLEGVQD